MLVFWKEKLVFLAVPKTGTTSLEGALAPKAAMVMRDPPILKHSPIYRYRRFIEPYFGVAGDDKLETLAVIRNPVDWLSSWYRYRHRDDLVGHPNSTRDISFDDFVEEYCKGKPAPYAGVGSQAKFVCGNEDEIVVDHLFQYEQQDKLVEFLENRLNTKIDLPRLNISPVLETPLSEKIEEKLRRKREIEFKVWDAARRD